MPTSLQVEVRGLRSLLVALREADPTMDRYMQGVLAEAGQLVIHEAVPLMRDQLVSPAERLTGELESTFRSQATRTSGKVREGLPSRGQYAGWWEFGGPRQKSNRPPNRKFVKGGRALYPAYHKVRPEIDLLVAKALEKIALVICTAGGRD